MKRRFANSINDYKNTCDIKRVDEKYFKGYVNHLTIHNVEKPLVINDGEFRVCIIDENYEWYQLYFDNENYALTIIFDDKENLVEWYFDVIKKSGLEKGVPYIDDLYLDLLILPNAKSFVLDEDELKDALLTKDITKRDYQMAYKTLEYLKYTYLENLNTLKSLTKNILDLFK